MLHIQQLSIENLDSILRFDTLCFPSDHWSEADWKMLLEDNRTIYYALTDQREIIGDIFIYSWGGEKDYVKIMNLAIHPDYRNHGFAHLLLNHMSAKMCELGMACFRGETRQSNQAMQRVFESCGYQLSTIEADYYGNPTEGACKYILQL